MLSSLKLKTNSNPTLRFREANTDEIKTFIEKLDPEKASQKFDVRTNILKKMQFFCEVHLR